MSPEELDAEVEALRQTRFLDLMYRRDLKPEVLTEWRNQLELEAQIEAHDYEFWIKRVDVLLELTDEKRFDEVRSNPDARNELWCRTIDPGMKIDVMTAHLQRFLFKERR